MNKALEKIKKLAKENDGDPEDHRELYHTVADWPREVHKERISEHRWWDIWLHVILVDGMYIGYHMAHANRDESVFDLGWDFDPETIQEMVPYETKVVKYKPVSDTGKDTK